MERIRRIIDWAKQVRTSIRYIGKKALEFTSGSIAAIQIVGFLCDFDQAFPEKWSFLTRLFISIAVVSFLFIAWLIIISLYVLRKDNTVAVINADNGHCVYLEYGDLLCDSNEKRNIVIPANRCFDTLVDDDLISRTTVHGKAILKICQNDMSFETLNEALQYDLANNRMVKPCVTLSRRNKRKGNLNRYPAGTIAEYKENNNSLNTYFFVGMSSFNSDLHPETSDEEYLITLQSLLEYCNQRSQRFPVYMPIIGTHGRNNKKSERELLEYMVDTFRFNKHLINTDIHIVVYSGRRADVSIYGL